MKAYLLSAFLHIMILIPLFWIASLPPRKTVILQDWKEVFLLERVPSPVYEKIPPAEEKEKKLVQKKETKEEKEEPRVPEKTLAQRLQERFEEMVVPKTPLVKAKRTEERRSKIEESLTREEIPEEKEKEESERRAIVELEPGFPDSWYITLLSRLLTENWQPPSEGIGVVKREVIVFFTIDQKGKIGNVSIVKTSGNLRFDRSGVSAVLASDNLPPLPPGWPRETLQVRVRFRER